MVKIPDAKADTRRSEKGRSTCKDAVRQARAGRDRTRASKKACERARAQGVPRAKMPTVLTRDLPSGWDPVSPRRALPRGAIHSATGAPRSPPAPRYIPSGRAPFLGRRVCVKLTLALLLPFAVGLLGSCSVLPGVRGHVVGTVPPGWQHTLPGSNC